MFRTTIAAAALFCVAGAAHAEIRLVNVTDGALRVVTRCEATSRVVTIEPGRSAALGCDGSARISLSMNGGPVLHAVLTDGTHYLDLDRDGALNVRRPGQAFAAKAAPETTLASR